MEDIRFVQDSELGVKRIFEDSRPRILSDNESCYISNLFQKFIDDKDKKYVCVTPYYPQSQGKIERYPGYSPD